MGPCPAEPGLEFTALDTAPPNGVHTFATPVGDNAFGDPTWSPDERHIAVLSPLESGCSVAIYQASATYDAFHLRAVLSFPYFATAGPEGPGCTIFGLSWSLDGTWLAFVQSSLTTSTIYGVRLATVLPALAQLDTQTSPPTPAIPFASLTTFATAASSAPAWSYTASGLALTFAGADGKQVVRRIMATGEQETLLTLPDGAVTALSWTPDSRQMAFVVDTLAYGVGVSAPSQLYVYTPPA